MVLLHKDLFQAVSYQNDTQDPIRFLLLPTEIVLFLSHQSLYGIDLVVFDCWDDSFGLHKLDDL